MNMKEKATRNGRIVKMYSQGMSCAEIAPFFGMSDAGIQSILKINCGIKLRTHKEASILRWKHKNDMESFITESISASASKPTIGFQSEPKPVQKSEQESPEQKNAQELQVQEKFEKITARIISTTNPAPSEETTPLLPEDREYMEAKYKKLLCSIEHLQAQIAGINKDVGIIRAILGK